MPSNDRRVICASWNCNLGLTRRAIAEPPIEAILTQRCHEKWSSLVYVVVFGLCMYNSYFLEHPYPHTSCCYFENTPMLALGATNKTGTIIKIAMNRKLAKSLFEGRLLLFILLSPLYHQISVDQV